LAQTGPRLRSPTHRSRLARSIPGLAACRRKRRRGAIAKIAQGKGIVIPDEAKVNSRLCAVSVGAACEDNEGTLIEAMQNAWRFVDDEVLRERLREAKGIGTPATRTEIIGVLKKQGFLIADYPSPGQFGFPGPAQGRR
jgi:hypothetical protein